MGTIEEATLARVKRRFAGRESAMERAYAASEAFRGLCRDFVACANALARWQEAEASGDRPRSTEYSELLDELTREIEVHLRTQGR